MTAKQQAAIAGINHARQAIHATLDELAPIRKRLPEGGIIGLGIAALQNCDRQLAAALGEIDAGDPDATPLPTSASQQFRAVKPGGLADRVNAELEKGKKKP